MPAEQLIFVGFELSNELRDAIAACPERDRVYIEDPTHLERCLIDDQVYIGKTVKNGVAVDRLEDTGRSVVSLLGRVVKGWPKTSATALVIAVEDQPTPAPLSALVLNQGMTTPTTTPVWSDFELPVTDS